MAGQQTEDVSAEITTARKLSDLRAKGHLANKNAGHLANVQGFCASGVAVSAYLAEKAGGHLANVQGLRCRGLGGFTSGLGLGFKARV